MGELPENAEPSRRKALSYMNKYKWIHRNITELYKVVNMVEKVDEAQKESSTDPIK